MHECFYKHTKLELYVVILFVSLLLFPTASVPFYKLKLFLLPMMELITKQLIDPVIHERFWSSHG